MQPLSAVALLLSVLWLAWGQKNPFRAEPGYIPPGCTSPLESMDMQEVMKKCPDLPVVQQRKAAEAARAQEPHFIPPFQDRVTFNSEQRPELCKQLDTYPPDHSWTWEEARERGNCVGMVVDGKRLYPTQENILGAIAAAKANAKAREQWNKEHSRVICGDCDKYDENGRLRDKAEEARLVEGWNKLRASGRCAAAAQRLVKNYVELKTACRTNFRATGCFQFANDKHMVGVCSVSPAEPYHGYKARAIMRDPMQQAVILAQEKPQSDSAGLLH